MQHSSTSATRAPRAPDNVTIAGGNDDTRSDMSPLTDGDFFTHAQAAVEDAARRAKHTLEQNPTLAIAGVVALGAIAALIIRSRMQRPETSVGRVQRDLERHARSLRRTVRRELRDSGASSTFDDLGQTLSKVDWRPYLQPIMAQAGDIADRAKAGFAAATK